MKIKSLRKRTKLSQSQFANKYAIPLKTLQKWEQDIADPLPYLVSLIQDDIAYEEFISIEKYMLKGKNDSFKVINKNRYKNIEHVHPIQQENVGKIVNALMDYETVKKIIIFGSSVTPKCNYQSDLDVYVELDKEENVKTYDVDVPVDFWTNFNVDPKMLEEIKMKGVVVYDRN